MFMDFTASICLQVTTLSNFPIPDIVQKLLRLNLNENKVLNVELESAFQQFGEVVVTGEKPDENVKQVRMSYQ
jgi:hypothetical protein